MSEVSLAILNFLEERQASMASFYLVNSLVDSPHPRTKLLAAIEILLSRGKLVLTSDKFLSIPAT
jgi:hypothetical protein